MSEKIIGIDLGTSNSAAAVYINGVIKTIPSAEGNTMYGKAFPSYVAFTKDGQLLVGEPARRQALTNPEGTVYAFKRKMGTDYKYKIWGKEYTPQQLSAFLLQKIKKDAESYLGEKINKAVITVPAYFNDNQRQATKDAGKIAGLEVKRIVNEPTAAALAYGFNKNKKEEKIAVYDLGGGTFDISILELGDGVFEVKATNGDTHLGGDNFDQRIIDWLIESFKKDFGIDLSQDRMALQRLKEGAEKAKIELSSTHSSEINLPFVTADASGPKHLQYTLTRAKFEQMVSDLVDGTRQPCLNALKDAGLSPSDVDEVILVGGSTRIPAVQEAVKNLFQKEPHKGVNPDEVVAMGAAIQGGILGGDVKDVLLLDVTPLSLGIETLGGVFTKLIERNTTIPTRKSQIFSTAADSQTAVSISVLQGEREMASQNRPLGRFDLVGIPAAPRGVPQIEVTFDIDANGIVHVSAKDLGTGKEQKIRIESSSGLSDAEIEKMVKDSELHAEEDRKEREKVEVTNEANSLIYSTEKSLKDFGDKVSSEDKAAIEAGVEVLKKALESGDIDQIKAKSEELKQTAHKLAEEIYKSTEANAPGAGQKAGSEGSAGGGGADTSQSSDNSQSANGTVEDIDYEVVDDEDSEK